MCASTCDFAVYFFQATKTQSESVQMYNMNASPFSRIANAFVRSLYSFISKVNSLTDLYEEG